MQSKFILPPVRSLRPPTEAAMCWKMLTRKRTIVRFVIYIITMVSSSIRIGERSAKATVCYTVLLSLAGKKNYRILW